MNVNRILAIACAAALSVVVARIFWPAGTSLGDRLFDGIYWLSVSFVPGYMVYLLVVFLPRKNDQKTLGVFIANQSSVLVGDAQSLLSELEKASGHKANVPATLADYQRMCGAIQLGAQAPMVKQANPIVYANWLEYISYYRTRSQQNADVLLQYMHYMEADHVRLVTEVRHCVLFFMVGVLPHVPAGANIGFLAEPLYGHYTLTRDLQQFNETHMKGVAWSKPRR